MTTVGNLTIRKIDDDLKQRLRVRAAEHGRSMEEEVRVILKTALADPNEDTRNWVRSIVDRFQELGGVELDLPPRAPARAPPDFSSDDCR